LKEGWSIPHPSQAQKLQTFLSNNANIIKCICASPDTDCKESGKITCFDTALAFVHIRFDPCMCSNREEKPKRCDCIIFSFDRDKEKQAMFVIEVKDKYSKPSLGELCEKLQYCIDTMQEILKGRMAIVETFPIVCDEKHSALSKYAAMATYKVKCYGTKKSIILNPYIKNIVKYYKWR
jgi:hypothetical protein